MAPAPAKTRIYQSEQFDGERWNDWKFRNDDIIVSTAMKSGTTWMLRIVGLLVFQDATKIDDEVMGAPWPDAAFAGPIEDILAAAEAMAHRRFMKSHVPIDGLPYNPNAKYINVVRDARDNFMSLQHHWEGAALPMYDLLDSLWPTPFPKFTESGDVHERWRRWMTEGRHDWVTDGYPFQSVFNFTEAFWKVRDTPNVLLVHYNDLKADLGGEMKRVAAFLDIEVPGADWPAYVEAATFEAMKRDLTVMVPEFDIFFDHGAVGFMNKGVNNRWKDVLTDDDLALYEQRASQLDPDHRNWLENGRLVAGNPQDW